MVGPIYAGKLKRLGISTILDLLFHLPNRYEDFSKLSKIVDISTGQKVSINGTITKFENIYTKYGKKIQTGIIRDETGEIELVWYNQPFLKNIIKIGVQMAISGEAKWFGHKLVLESPEYEFIKPSTCLVHTGRIVPVYSETKGVSSKWLRSRINSILTKFFPYLPEILPQIIIDQFHLVNRSKAINYIHFPQNWTQVKEARRRLSFEELLIVQIAADIRKKEISKRKVGHKFEVTKILKDLDIFIRNLPFKLTSAQKRVIDEILVDLAKNKPMNRLLEGDVGSGKTVIAAICMYLTHLNGYKTAFLAPTEILANQHFQTIKQLLSPYDITVELITGSTKKTKTLKKNLIPTNKFNIFIGTHALLSEKILIEDLGLVIIDEQQRFGVEQRALLREKGDNPHVLILTATPIPRTIALTLYADLDLSILDEMPIGRKKIKTWVVPKEKRKAAYGWIKTQIIKSKHKKQAFIICPFIEESESLDTVKAATTEYKYLKTEVFPDLKLGMLHGRLSSQKKDKVMNDFQNGKLDILVATPVVEVGIDIPSATIMMIEGSERFGLAQLHQLRGRVGRGSEDSYCLIFSESDSEKSTVRLKILETVFSGPKLSEYDLKLRGMGDVFGTKQHGHFGLKIADITDLVLLAETQEAANILMTNYKSLSSLPLLKEEVQKYTIGKVAPD